MQPVPLDPIADAAKIMYAKPAATPNAAPTKTAAPTKAAQPAADNDAPLTASEVLYGKRAKPRAAEVIPPAADDGEEQQATADASDDGVDATDDGYAITAPETADPETAKAYSSVAKELNVDQATAQQLFDKMLPKLQERHDARVAAETKKWGAEVRREHGTKLHGTIESAKLAVRAYGDASLRELLASGIGDHPALVRFLARVGRELSEAQ